MSKRTKSFLWGGIVGLAILIFGICCAISISDYTQIAFWAVLGVSSFTLVSCLFLGNNFIGDMIGEICSWGFVKMPGIIFELDLDGIIWLLTVKLLFWILGLVLACVCTIFGILLGLVVSIFVYPFALHKNIKHGEIE